MELYIEIIIMIVSGLFFGFMARDKQEKQKINLGWSLLAVVAGLFFNGFMPLLITIWCVIICYIHFHQKQDCNTKLWTSLTFFVVGTVFFYAYPFIPATTEVVETENISLTALHSTVASSGDFLLGIGNVEGKLYYVYGYMKGDEFVQELKVKTPNVHVYPNRTDGGGNIISYQSFNVRNTSAWPINLLFNGAPKKMKKDSWTDILIPPDSIIQEIKI